MFKVMGSKSYLRSQYRFDRYWRNIRILHDPVTTKCAMLGIKLNVQFADTVLVGQATEYQF